MKYLPRYFKIYFVFQNYCEANNISRHNRYFHSHCPVMSHHNLMYSLHTNTHNEYQCLNVAYFSFFSFLCCPIMCLYVLSYALWCPLRFPYKNDVQLTVRLCLQSFVGGLMSNLHYLFCLRIVVSNTYCVVFLFCLSYPMLPVSLDCPFLIALRCSLMFIVVEQ
jgi:hypothetical protein